MTNLGWPESSFSLSADCLVQVLRAWLLLLLLLLLTSRLLVGRGKERKASTSLFATLDTDSLLFSAGPSLASCFSTGHLTISLGDRVTVPSVVDGQRVSKLVHLLLPASR